MPKLIQIGVCFLNGMSTTSKPITETGSPITKVVEAIADEKRADMEVITPLQHSVDGDLLRALSDSDVDFEVAFQHDDCRVQISNDGVSVSKAV